MDRTLKIERLHRFTEAQKAELVEFGCGFGHSAPQTFPVDLAYVDGQLKGWYAVHQHAVIYPALDPKRTSPRDFYRLFVHLLGVYRQRYGDPWMVLDRNYPNGGPTPETLKRFGVRPFDRTILEVCPP